MTFDVIRIEPHRTVKVTLRVLPVIDLLEVDLAPPRLRGLCEFAGTITIVRNSAPFRAIWSADLRVRARI